MILTHERKAAGKSQPEEGDSPAQAKPRRSVCAPRAMAFSFYRRPGLERRSIMSLTSWLRNRRLNRTGRNRAQRPTAALRFRPQLEVLEGRDVPSTLTVTTLSDNGGGATLRNEIAIAQSGDTIVF